MLGEFMDSLPERVPVERVTPSVTGTRPPAVLDNYFDMLSDLVRRYGYAVVFLAMVLENTIGLGIVVPGLLILLLGGYYAGLGELAPGGVLIAGVAGTLGRQHRLPDRPGGLDQVGVPTPPVQVVLRHSRRVFAVARADSSCSFIFPCTAACGYRRCWESYASTFAAGCSWTPSVPCCSTVASSAWPTRLVGRAQLSIRSSSTAMRSRRCSWSRSWVGRCTWGGQLCGAAAHRRRANKIAT